MQSSKIQMEKAEIALELFKLYEFPKEVEKLFSDYSEARRELERIEARARSRLAQAEAKLSSNKATYLVRKERLEKLQKQLADKGYYKGKIDGIVGQETLKAWDRWYGDKMCVKLIKKMSEEKRNESKIKKEESKWKK